SVDALPEHYRVPLLLHHVDGYSYKEVAETLSSQEATVRKRVSRGIGLLREALAVAGFTIEDAALPAIIAGMPKSEYAELCARILNAAKNSKSGAGDNPEAGPDRIRVFKPAEQSAGHSRRALAAAALLLLGCGMGIFALGANTPPNGHR